jgi:large subunit ribosomal protein L24
MRAKIKKDDVVIARTGKERFGKKTGKVLKVLTDKNQVIVQGLNLVKRHTKPSQKHQKGGIVEREAPLAVSNVMVYCTRCKRGARVGLKVLKNGSKLRVCKRCGESLDK